MGILGQKERRGPEKMAGNRRADLCSGQEAMRLRLGGNGWLEKSLPKQYKLDLGATN